MAILIQRWACYPFRRKPVDFLLSKLYLLDHAQFFMQYSTLKMFILFLWNDRASTTKFAHFDLIPFANGSSKIATMTDYNHAAKYEHPQLRSIVEGGEAYFDVRILSIAGINSYLYCVNNCSLDVVVLKLCRSVTTLKLLA